MQVSRGNSLSRLEVYCLPGTAPRFTVLGLPMGREEGRKQVSRVNAGSPGDARNRFALQRMSQLNSGQSCKRRVEKPVRSLQSPREGPGKEGLGFGLGPGVWSWSLGTRGYS